MKLRIGVLAAVLAVVSGCQEAAKCAVQADCPGNAQCIRGADGQGYCVESSAADSGADAGLDGGDAGAGTDAGTDGGTEDGGGVPGPCDNAMCPMGYECRTSGNDAGVCELAFSALELVSPDGGTYGPDASVVVVARLVRKPGFMMASGPTLASIFVDATDAGTAMRSGDEYALQLGTAGMSEGAHQVTVTATFADAGLTSDGGFEVDATGPELRPTVVSTPGYGMNQTDVYYPTDPDQPTSFRKDALVEVEVTSPATDVDVGSVVLEVGSSATGGSRTISMSQSCPGAPAAFCRRFSVDLAQVPLNAMRGELALRAVGTDIRQNAGTRAPGTPTVPVTRWRWATRLTNGSIKATPALTSQGHVAVGVVSGSNQGVTLVAPDAGVLWRAGTQPVEASPVVGARLGGAQFVFFQQRDSSETLLAANASTGALLSGCGANLSVLPASTPVSSALVQDGSEDVGIVGTQPRSIGFRIAGYRPFANSSCYATNASGGAFPGNIVTDGVTAYYPDDTGRLTSADISNPSSIGTPTQFPGASMATGTVNGLSLFATGTQLAGGGGGGPGIGALFQFLVPTGADAGVVAGTPVTAPVVTSNGDVIAGFRNNTRLELRKYSSGAVQLGSAVLTGANSTGNPGVASPVLGAGDAVHLVGNGGYLVAANQSDLSIRYEGPVTMTVALGAVTASPTMDCNRERPGSESGILYVATEAGYLVSIIVDSKGLDTTAQWPKYQRDAQNSGNVGRPMPPACP